MTNDIEIPLSGGRITNGVTRKGDFVLRPLCGNSAFVHSVLRWLEHKAVDCCPRFIGLDDKGREITTFLPGWSPPDLGYYTDEQCVRAVSIIKTLHEALCDFPGCAPGQTVCHYDLSPCNFMFQGDMPYAVFDWDSAAIGNPLDDLAYAIWMWLDIGNDELDGRNVAIRMKMMLDRYGARENRSDFCSRIVAQMDRVGNGRFPSEEYSLAAKAWTNHCKDWFSRNLDQILANLLSLD